MNFVELTNVIQTDIEETQKLSLILADSVSECRDSRKCEAFKSVSRMLSFVWGKSENPADFVEFCQNVDILK